MGSEGLEESRGEARDEGGEWRMAGTRKEEQVCCA